MTEAERLPPCPLCGESKGYDKSWNSSELFCRACCRRVAINNAVAAKLRQTDDAAWNAAAAHAQGLREREQRTASYATALAVSLHAQHFSEVTQWKPLPDTLGLLTQIDNMVVGLRERIAELEREMNREMRADALRLRWLADDHADPETRERVRSICQSLPTRSISGVRLDVDAAMRP